jgi:cell division protein FtsI/penicillin-binding protein 2
LKKFGLGNKTYLPLNNESGGKIRSISEWSRTSKNYISIGQEIALTNLQLAIAYCTIANGGYMIKPKIIKKIVKNEDISYINKTTKIRKVLDKEIANNILKTLKLVVSDGTAKSINLIGYNIAGKTGTAQKFENGTYSKFIATFASIFPTNNPEFVMIVSIDEPAHGKHWANLSAVPTSREIIKRMIILNKDFHNKTSDKFYVNTTIDSTYNIINNQTVTFGEIPDFRGMSLRESFRVAEVIGLKLNPKGVSGTVLNQSIPPGTRLKPNMICKITMKI